jgi:hypothetical protein
MIDYLMEGILSASTFKMPEFHISHTRLLHKKKESLITAKYGTISDTFFLFWVSIL